MQRSNQSDIREITAHDAIRFYRQWKRAGDQVSFTDKGKFIACVDTSGLGEIVGIASAQMIGGSMRIKTLMVRSHAQRKGVGTALLSALVFPGLRYTAFATQESSGLFAKFGFVVQSVNRNNISFMVKVAS